MTVLKPKCTHLNREQWQRSHQRDLNLDIDNAELWWERRQLHCLQKKEPPAAGLMEGLPFSPERSLELSPDCPSPDCGSWARPIQPTAVLCSFWCRNCLHGTSFSFFKSSAPDSPSYKKCQSDQLLVYHSLLAITKASLFCSLKLVGKGIKWKEWSKEEK